MIAKVYEEVIKVIRSRLSGHICATNMRSLQKLEGKADKIT